MNKNLYVAFAVSVALTGTIACTPGHSEEEAQKPQGAPEATAKVAPTQGNQAQGTVTFQKASGGVRIVAQLSGLKPGSHGFHIHMNGDCSAPDASSAGDHFNPKAGQHGDRYDEHSHIGDMGNILADDSGNASLDYVDPHMALEGADTVIGRAVIVHANPDDLSTQPSGNAGPRIGCGVITKTTP